MWLTIPILLQQITSSFPSHPANSFFYPRLKHLPPIAKVTLTKVKKTKQIISLPVEPTQSNQLPTGNEIEDKLISKSKRRRMKTSQFHSVNVPQFYSWCINPQSTFINMGALQKPRAWQH